MPGRGKVRIDSARGRIGASGVSGPGLLPVARCPLPVASVYWRYTAGAGRNSPDPGRKTPVGRAPCPGSSGPRMMTVRGRGAGRFPRTGRTWATSTGTPGMLVSSFCVVVTQSDGISAGAGRAADWPTGARACCGPGPWGGGRVREQYGDVGERWAGQKGGGPSRSTQPSEPFGPSGGGLVPGSWVPPGGLVPGSPRLSRPVGLPPESLGPSKLPGGVPPGLVPLVVSCACSCRSRHSRCFRHAFS
jgi:hypothetical protein